MQAIKGRILIKVDTEQKNNYSFADGTVLKLERDVENLDRKYVSQVLGEVIESEYIPKGAMVLFHHNSIHDVNTIFDSDYLTKAEIEGGYKVISLIETECFLWKHKGYCSTWNPLKNFCTALRVFEPYQGRLAGVEPRLLKNVLYLTSGIYKGKAVIVLKASDYCITFRNEMGVDEQIIRCRNYEDEENDKQEVIAINGYLTNKIKSGKLLVGIGGNDCKKVN